MKFVLQNVEERILFVFQIFAMKIVYLCVVSFVLATHGGNGALLTHPDLKLIVSN